MRTPTHDEMKAFRQGMHVMIACGRRHLLDNPKARGSTVLHEQVNNMATWTLQAENKGFDVDDSGAARKSWAWECAALCFAMGALFMGVM